jgi:hypothetical protein
MPNQRSVKRRFEISEELERHIQRRERIARRQGEFAQATRSQYRLMRLQEALERGDLPR